MSPEDAAPGEEFHYLCRLGQSFLLGAPPPPPSADLDWGRLGCLSVLNGLGPLLAATVPLSLVPPDAAAAWRSTLATAVHRAHRALRAACRLLSVLEGHGIPAIALRGVALAHTVYPAPFLRPMADVDVLIAEAHRQRAQTILRREGLEEGRPLRSQFVYYVDGIYCELHWSFFTARRYRHCGDFGAWLSARRAVQTPLGTLFCAGPEHELLGVACHAWVHHEIDRLLQLLDVALVAAQPGFDWAIVVDWARRARLERLLSIVLGCADGLLGTQLSAQAGLGTAFWRGAKGERLTASVAARLGGEDGVVHFLRRKRAQLWCAEALAVWLRQALRFLSPSELGQLARLLRRRP